MRARWLALGLLLGLASLAWGQAGGPGFFMAPACITLPNPVTGQTVCWQSTAPNGWFYWDGAAFTSAGLAGPYTPTSYLAGAVLVGGGVGPITATTTPTVDTLTTTSGTPAIQINPVGGGSPPGEIRFLENTANGSDYVGIRAPNQIAASFVLRLPANVGTSGQCLGTDGAAPANLSWVACSPGAGSGISTLNALTNTNQSFANDTNVTMVSAVSTHTLTWAGTLAVARGGSGAGTFTTNGVLLGNSTSAFQVTAAGAANTVLRVPGAGGTPAFGALDVSQAAAITGLVRTANLGSGTASSATFLRGDQTWAQTAGSGYNYVFNADMEVWGAGPATVPTGWTLGGTGSAAKNTTVGQFKMGTASLALTSPGPFASVSQRFDVTYPPVSAWQSQVVTCGAWARATVAGGAVVRIDDGVSPADSGGHSGSGAFEFLQVTRTISNVATYALVQLIVGPTTSQFDAITCVRGGAIATWEPSGWLGRKAILTYSTGSSPFSTGTTHYLAGGRWSLTETQSELLMPFRCVMRNVYARVDADPSGAQSVTFRMRMNELNLGIGNIVVNGGQFENSNVTEEADVAKGARTAVRAITSAVALANYAVVTAECEEVPQGI